MVDQSRWRGSGAGYSVTPVMGNSDNVKMEGIKEEEEEEGKRSRRRERGRALNRNRISQYKVISQIAETTILRNVVINNNNTGGEGRDHRIS